MSGLYTAALYLINTYAYTAYRGYLIHETLCRYISGLANVFSVLGIMTCAFIGGILQDKWNNVAPFNLFGLMSVLGLIMVVVSAWGHKTQRRSVIPLFES
jgi:predicted MFS family arabinose efflux permease